MRNTKAWRLMAAMVAGLCLLSRPQCVRGCRTVAEHLLTHGIYGLFS